MTTELKDRRILFFIIAALVIATLIAYEPIRHNGFVTYDDGQYIYDNPQITAGISWQSLGQALTKPHFFMWHPLTTISHMLDCQFFGLNPLGHHFVSLLLHITNVLLLFWILKNITDSASSPQAGTMWASAFAAAVFALHPVQVESVAWASERKTVLSGLLLLLTMATYIRYARQPRLGRYLVVLLVFGLCIMTKPVVVTLPLALLLLDYWPLDRVRWEQPAKTKSNQKSAGWLIAEKIPLIAISVLLSVMTYVAQKQGGIVPTLEKMPLDYRAANMFLTYVRYIGKMIWPSGLAVCYPHPRAILSDGPVVTCMMLFIVLTILSIYIGRRKKYAAVGWLWYVGTLVPVIGLVQSGAQAMANRYMYIPMLGLLIIIGWSVKDLIINRPRIRIAATVIGVIALLSLLILTRMQVRHWQNTLTLFEYTLSVTKDNPVIENSYGVALFNEGRTEEAERHLRNAVQISPVFVDARNNLAKVYLKEGKYNEAIANLYEIIRRNEGTAEVYYNLAAALEMQKKYEDAIKYYAKSLELNPRDPAANKRMGITLLAAGKTNDAIRYAQRACELTGNNNAEYLDTLAVTYAAAGRFEEAKATANKALGIAKSSSREDLAGEIQERIKLYEAGQPYRQK
jgi:Flp pilus assembly protein TadD